MVDSKAGCYKILRNTSHGVAAKVREIRNLGHENWVGRINFCEEVTALVLPFRSSSPYPVRWKLLTMRSAWPHSLRAQAEAGVVANDETGDRQAFEASSLNSQGERP